MNLVITGLMGTGKTTTGKLVAKKLQRDFIDTDEYLNDNFGSAEKILNQPDGDMKFREIETIIAHQLSVRSNIVISTGGRFLLNQSNIHLLSRNGYIICLRADLDDLVERLLHAQPDTYRPRFFNAKNKLELLRDLEHQSDPFYSQFESINTSGLDLEGITDKIVSQFLFWEMNAKSQMNCNGT